MSSNTSSEAAPTARPDATPDGTGPHGKRRAGAARKGAGGGGAGGAAPRRVTADDIRRHKRWKELDLDVSISLKNRYVYVMISKAASSTVTYHLRHAEYEGTSYKVRDVNDPHLSPHVRPFQLTPSRFLAILGDPAFRKVAVVRNPYSRLLSCYLHRIVGKKGWNPSKRRLARHLPAGQAAHDISFAEFVEIVADMETLEMERHWAVQHDSILYPLLDYDFIGKQENLVEDMLKMEALVFGREVFDRAKLDTLNLAPMRTGSNSKVLEYYDDRLAAKVADRFRIDFETFGYDTDPALAGS